MLKCEYIYNIFLVLFWSHQFSQNSLNRYSTANRRFKNEVKNARDFCNFNPHGSNSEMHWFKIRFINLKCNPDDQHKRISSTKCSQDNIVA
jgi:hypothetical protein